MFQHLLRYVGEENWFLLLKRSRHRADTRYFGTNLDRRRVRFLVELKEMQTFSVTPQDVEVGSMEATTAAQNVAQAVQDGFYRRLLDHRTGGIQQSSVSILGAPHGCSTALSFDT
jgi:hypothetical protein